MGAWSDFFVAEVGASAALAGLLFVAVSVNLTQILSLPGLPGRAGMALVVLGQVLLVATCLLVPDQSTRWAGVETLVIGALAWATLIAVETRIPRPDIPGARRDVLLRWTLGQLATLPFIIAGIVLLGWGERGLGWVVPGVAFAFVFAFAQAWVLLVEINR